MATQQDPCRSVGLLATAKREGGSRGGAPRSGHEREEQRWASSRRAPEERVEAGSSRIKAGQIHGCGSRIRASQWLRWWICALLPPAPPAVEASLLRVAQGEGEAGLSSTPSSFPSLER